MIKISPSILSADCTNLEKEIKALEESGADMIHIDVMDGHFVPNLTFGFIVIKSIKRHTNLPLDVHLMIEKPEQYIKQYVDAGADILTIHPEATTHLNRTLNNIKDMNIRSGVALLPTTSPDVIDYILDITDLVLVMTVNPGFGGQKFIANQLHKIKLLSTKIKEYCTQNNRSNIILSVDGGINADTAKKCIECGADMLVSGSYIFDGEAGLKLDIESIKSHTSNKSDISAIVSTTNKYNYRTQINKLRC